MSNGKGDKRRPKNIPYDEWSKKYEEIFKKKNNKKEGK